MSTYNSIVLGNASGYIKNVQFVRGYRKPVARTKISSRRINTNDGVNDSRRQFKNAVRGWYWNKQVYANQKPVLATKRRSRYNDFISEVKKWLPDTYVMDYYSWIASTKYKSTSRSKWPVKISVGLFGATLPAYLSPIGFLRITGVTKNAGYIRITFDSQGMLYMQGAKLRTSGMRTTASGVHVNTYSLSESTWNNGFYDITFETWELLALTVSIYLPNQIYCSNIYFSQKLIV